MQRTGGGAVAVVATLEPGGMTLWLTCRSVTGVHAAV